MVRTRTHRSLARQALALVLPGLMAVLLSGCMAGDGGVKTQLTQSAAPPSADEGQIRGVVTDEEELPVEGAEAGLFGLPDVHPVSTDAEGVFVITDLAPGTYELVVTKIGYEASTGKVQVVSGTVVDAHFRLKPLQVTDDSYTLLIMGETYIACGAYVNGYSVTNLNACPWDSEHDPRFEFSVDAAGLRGIMQEVTWLRTSPLAGERLTVGLWYKLVCNPFCEAAAQYATGSGSSPVRLYADLTGEKFEEDPVPLESTTYVGGNGPEIVVVYQQRATHYLTVFYNAPGSLATYSALPP